MKTKAKSKRKTSNQKTSLKFSTKPSKSRAKKKSMALSINGLFSAPKNKTKKPFTTSFEYGNLSVNISSTIKGGIILFKFHLVGKNFSFNGVATINERAFLTFNRVFNHIMSNVRT